jgi:hypothetical protein
LSEGNSDSEGEEDDLSKKQISKLFKCIKNKKFRNLDKCKFSPTKKMKSDDDEDEEHLNNKGE